MPKISQLPPGTSLAGTEMVPDVQSGATVRTTPSAIATYVLGQLPDLQVEVKDANFEILNSVDTTKVAKFSAAAISPATTRTFDFPDVSGTLSLTSQVREKLSSPRVYWVRQGGNNNNDGLTYATAFATPQHAVDIILNTLDTSGHFCYINIADSATTGVQITNLPIGGGGIVFRGDNLSPISWSKSGGNLIEAFYNAIVYVQGFDLSTSVSGRCILSSAGATVIVSNTNYGACASAHNEAANMGTIVLGTRTIHGNAVSHIHVPNDGLVLDNNNVVTISGTPSFSAYYAGLSNGCLEAIGTSYIGSATGRKFFVHYNGSIRTDTNNPNLFPGDTNNYDISKGGVYDYLSGISPTVNTSDSEIVGDSGSVIIVDTTAGNITRTLPAANVSYGVNYTYKKIVAANILIISASGSDLIDGLSSQQLSSQWSSLAIYCDGSSWYITSMI